MSSRWYEDPRKVIPALALLTGLASTVTGASQLAESINALTWATTQGEVTESRVMPWRAGSGSTTRAVWLSRVRYHYAVDGHGYDNSRLYFHDRPPGNYSKEPPYGQYDSPEEADAVVRAHPVGAPVNVHYDPGNPAHAVVHKDFRWFSLALLGYGVIFGVVGIVGTALQLAPREPLEPSPGQQN